MIDAVDYVLLPDTLHSLLDHRAVAILDEAGKLLGPQLAKGGLNF